jgi:hypothetical protein
MSRRKPISIGLSYSRYDLLLLGLIVEHWNLFSLSVFELPPQKGIPGSNGGNLGDNISKNFSEIRPSD